jgi:hypothetical protein
MIERSTWATPVREEIDISSPHTATLTGLRLAGGTTGEHVFGVQRLRRDVWNLGSLTGTCYGFILSRTD